MEQSEAQIIEAVELNDSQSWLRVAKDVGAGTCGGIAQVLVGQPFDTTKVRLQSAPPGTYAGASDVIRQLMKTEGPLAFYKGTLTPLVGVGVCVSLQFGIFEGMKRLFTSRNLASGQPAALQYNQFYLSGVTAGLANSLLATPIEHIRIRLQTQTAATPRQFSGPVDVIKQLVRLGGYRNIYHGFVPTCWREAHGMGIYFLTYEYLVNRDMRNNAITRTEIPGYRLCIYGGLAGYSVWICSYQFDVVKSKMQADSIDPLKRQYAGAFDCIKKTYATFGIKGFFRGFVPTILRAAPVNASTFYAFELAMRAFG
ncbi:mitochondrial carrier domain-containing protein [Limtongia smithiae]|uniref:mitochondrial carrier domain-containing protein n=1 Tax=Limtongia smithiae TaxID=1125753 RepID=UPI0034CEBE4D